MVRRLREKRPEGSGVEPAARVGGSGQRARGFRPDRCRDFTGSRRQVFIAGRQLDGGPNRQTVVHEKLPNRRIAHAQADVPEGEGVLADMETGLRAVTVEENQAGSRRFVPAALGQAEKIVPVFDERVEDAVSVHKEGCFDEPFPPVPEPAPKGNRQSLGLAVYEDFFGA